MTRFQITKWLSRLCICTLGVVPIFALGAAAQTPGRTITIVVPYTPGTGPDMLARVIGEELQRRWGQPVVVENKPGASGNIGTQFVAKAAPDGHTLLMASMNLTQNVGLYKSIPYDPIKSFEPIVEVAESFLALAVHPSVPASSARAFIDYAKARPGEINYSSPGRGTPHHLSMELFKFAAGVDLKHVPYRGSAPAIQDLVGGHVSAMFISINVALPMAQANQIRLLAVASKERLSVAPDVPTFREMGITGVDYEFWPAGLLAPAGTPRETVIRYNTAVNDILRSPHVAEKFTKLGMVIVGGTHEHFSELIARDLAKWPKIIEQAGIIAE
jgi:tripartite-type tricarboxylate transporter receptor subunit TctC